MCPGKPVKSPGILSWHFPGLESSGNLKPTGPGKFWKSVKVKLRNIKCIAGFQCHAIQNRSK